MFSPDRIAELLVQYGIQTARGYVDITYEDLSVDVLRSNASARQVKIWPMHDWDGGEDCVISIEKVELIGNVFTNTEDSRGEIAVQGLNAPLVCLPAEMRIPVVAAGQQRIQVSLLRSTFDYNVPSSSFKAQVTARLPSFAAFDFRADVQYISYWFRDAPPSYPVIYLDGARLRVENLGGWEELRPVLPPRLTDPERGAEALAELLVAYLASAFDITRPFSAAQQGFIDSATTTWAEFLADPTQLTLSFLDDTDGAVFIDFEGLDRNEEDPFEELQPKLTSGWRPVSTLMSLETITSALNDETFDSREKLKVAEALISGIGVPRNTTLGMAILTELAGAGEVRAQTALAELLSERDTEEAYALAIAAANNGSESAVLLLDQLERDMTWNTVTQLQPASLRDAIDAIVSEEDVASIRALASDSLRGVGAPRSYSRAMYWGLLGQAFGDQESAWIVEEVERRVSAFDDSDLQEFLGPIEDAVLEFWVMGQGDAGELPVVK